jgi:hypothetical protein
MTIMTQVCTGRQGKSNVCVPALVQPSHMCALQLLVEGFQLPKINSNRSSHMPRPSVPQLLLLTESLDTLACAWLVATVSVACV